MHIVSIYGSPHKNGFSSTLHDLFLEGIEDLSIEVKRIDVYDLTVSPCIDCGNCKKSFSCIYNDMITIYDEIKNSIGFVISSPVYFTSIPGQLKIFFDRFQLFWEYEKRGNLVVKDKPSFFISTGGAEYENMFKPAFITVKHYLNTIGSHINEDDVFYLSSVDNLNEIPVDLKEKIKELGRKFAQKLLR